jgi:phosphoglycolate phosphatase
MSFRPHETTGIDLIVFDLDGTLVDSREDIVHAMNQGIEAVWGRSLPQEEIAPLIGRPLEDMFARLLPADLESRISEAVAVYRRVYFDHCTDRSRPFPGVVESLESLQGIPMAVATTKPTYMARRVVQGLGLQHHFDVVLGSDGLPHKPDPALPMRLLSELGMRPGHSWMVGDTVLDVLAGKAARMSTCAVTYGFGDYDDLFDQQPDLLVDDLAQFRAHILASSPRT